jgi:hypothetical protein
MQCTELVSLSLAMASPARLSNQVSLLKSAENIWKQILVASLVPSAQATKSTLQPR